MLPYMSYDTKLVFIVILIQDVINFQKLKSRKPHGDHACPSKCIIDATKDSVKIIYITV